LLFVYRCKYFETHLLFFQVDEKGDVLSSETGAGDIFFTVLRYTNLHHYSWWLRV